jgi:hypothetical protein
VTIPDRYQGRARSKGYTPPRPNFTPKERLEECLRIADRIEHGQATPIDEIALKAHLRTLAAADEPGETP